jgi:hypothetical protein
MFIILKTKTAIPSSISDYEFLTEEDTPDGVKEYFINIQYRKILSVRCLNYLNAIYIDSILYHFYCVDTDVIPAPEEANFISHILNLYRDSRIDKIFKID